MVTRALKVCKVIKEILEHKVYKEQLVILDHKVYRAISDCKEIQAIRVLKVI